mgnify:CR=1 FL=1
MRDNNNQDARTSCEETFTEDMGPATWANEDLGTALEANNEAMTHEPFHTDAQAEFGTAAERLAERS